MIESLEQFVSLVEDGGEKSQDRLHNDDVAELILVEIVQKRADLCRIITLRKNLPESIVCFLAKSEDPSVRADIATRRSVPCDIREILARDADESVRARVAYNKKTPTPLLELLAADKSPIVAEPAIRQLRKSE